MSRIAAWNWRRSVGFALGLARSTRDHGEPNPGAGPEASRAGASAEKPGRHLFAVELLGEGRKYRAYDYYYRCARCRWLFMVDRQGGVIAMKDRDRPLPISEGNYRVRTFAHGPCTNLATEALPRQRYRRAVSVN